MAPTVFFFYFYFFCENNFLESFSIVSGARGATTLSFCLSTLSGQFSELVSSFCQEVPHAEMEGVEVMIAS